MDDIEIRARHRMMATLAEATSADIAEIVTAFGPLPQADDLRAPEIGLTMVRGRIGGDGAPFNLGEASVTRAAVRLADGTVGISYRLGRDPATTRTCAVLDALWQDTARRRDIDDRVIARLADRNTARRQLDAERAAATRVDFFTMVRGENTA